MLFRSHQGRTLGISYWRSPAGLEMVPGILLGGLGETVPGTRSPGGKQEGEVVLPCAVVGIQSKIEEAKFVFLGVRSIMTAAGL